MKTWLTFVVALLSAAMLLTGCASPGPLPDALPSLGASADNLPLAVRSDRLDANLWQAMSALALDALLYR